MVVDGHCADIYFILFQTTGVWLPQITPNFKVGHSWNIFTKTIRRFRCNGLRESLTQQDPITNTMPSSDKQNFSTGPWAIGDGPPGPTSPVFSYFKWMGRTPELTISFILYICEMSSLLTWSFMYSFAELKSCYHTERMAVPHFHKQTFCTFLTIHHSNGSLPNLQ